jgi:hypothetical protein
VPVQFHNKTMQSVFCTEIPFVFSCLEEAKNTYDYHRHGSVRFFEDLKEQCPMRLHNWVESRRHFLAQTLQDWSRALEESLHSSGAKLKPATVQAAHVLKIRQLIGLMKSGLEDPLSSRNEMVWDKYCSTFREIISLVNYILEIGNPDDHDRLPGTPNFTLDFGIVGPLGAVGFKCRHPVLRREAIRLLSTAPKREAGWNSTLSARVCTRIMQIEEEGLGPITRCEDIPGWARISDIELDIDLQARRFIMKYRRQGDSQHPTQEYASETITY